MQGREVLGLRLLSVLHVDAMSETNEILAHRTTRLGVHTIVRRDDRVVLEFFNRTYSTHIILYPQAVIDRWVRALREGR